MAECCHDKSCEIEALKEKQGSVLKIVLVINAAMFLVESTAGIIAGSTALLADSLDMLGDALVYGFSLYVLGMGIKWQARSALLKGFIMAGSGLFVLGEVFYKLIYPAVPSAATIGWIGLLALAMNALCLGLLWRHRTDDINMHSVWLCSRNDIIANTSVLAAGLGVWLTNTGWPDIAVGLVLAAVFFKSAVFVVLRAWRHINGQAV